MIYWELFYVFFLIGLFTFGGGYAMIPLIEGQVVGRGWCTEEKLLQYIGVSEATPGPFAVNIATFVGSSQGGFLGSLLATLGVILPSLIIIIIVAFVLSKFLKNKYVQGALNGVKPIVLSLVLSTAILITVKIIFFASKGLQSQFVFDVKALIVLISLGGFAFLYRKVKKRGLHPILLILLSALVGIIVF